MAREKSVTIEVDDENNAETFWGELESAFPAVAEELQGTGRAVIGLSVWERIRELPSFSDGPNYAKDALIVCE